MIIDQKVHTKIAEESKVMERRKDVPTQESSCSNDHLVGAQGGEEEIRKRTKTGCRLHTWRIDSSPLHR